jgi:hypothetical protein
MMRREESGPPAEGGGEPSREALEQRVRELEAENGQLRARLQYVETELEIATDALAWHEHLAMPASEAEMLERAKNGPTLGDLIAECQREFADGNK